jgi:hypothetical protein
MERLFPYNWEGSTASRAKLARALINWYLVNALGLIIYTAAICLVIKVIF